MWLALTWVELAAGVLSAAVFSVEFIRRRQWRLNRASTQLWVMITYLGALIGLRFIDQGVVALPQWVWALAWAPLTPVIARWTWLLYRPERVGPTDPPQEGG